VVADQALERQPFQQGAGLPAVGGLPGRQREEQGPAEAVDDRVDLGRRTAARAAGRLLTATPRAAREALRLAGGRVEHHGPERVGRKALEEQLVPDALASPTPEAAADRPGLVEPGREILPREAGAQHVGHGLDEPP
jgi:hypothetical protein